MTNARALPLVAFAAALTTYGIAHTAETCGGDHVNHIDERLAGKVQPFFSAHLAFE